MTDRLKYLPWSKFPTQIDDQQHISLKKKIRNRKIGGLAIYRKDTYNYLHNVLRKN